MPFIINNIMLSNHSAIVICYIFSIFNMLNIYKTCVYFLITWSNICVFCIAQSTNLGTTLYTSLDVKGRNWTDSEGLELHCRMMVGLLVPTKIPVNGNDFLIYFELIRKNTNNIVSKDRRKRVMVLVADVIGGYLYTMMLPQVRILYYEGKSNYPTTKLLHDLMEKIKYILGTDGRDWAKPVVGKRSDPKTMTITRPKTALKSNEVTEGIMERCGGVDAGPYGLSWRQDWNVPFFDNDTQPRSLVVPWRPGRPMLYSIRDAGCHRALFDHCVESSDRGWDVRSLWKWLNATVKPLVSPEAAAADHWYPALWGASLVAQHVDKVAATMSDYHPGVPNANFYAAIVLASATVCWTIALCTLFLDECMTCLCFCVKGVP